MEESANKNVEVKIEALRKNLLDLTMRNKLLNFKSLARSIRVVDEIPTEIYQLLVLNDKKMQFIAKQTRTTESHANKDNNNLNNDDGKAQEESQTSENSKEKEEEIEELKLKPIEMSENDASLLWKLPLPNKKVAAKPRNLFLQTNHEAEELQKRLFYINQQSKSVLEEQGYNILYLALGFLEWTDNTEENVKRRAP